VYRPPSPPHPMNITAHINEFSHHLDILLTNLSDRYHTSYICLDSNINQLTTHPNHPSHEYFQTIASNGFVQCILNATRIVGNSYSLIDHIVTNDRDNNIKCGTVILDVSDHFMTFIQLPKHTVKVKSNANKSRKFATENVNNFKQNLQTQTWDSVLSCNNVNDSYKIFWDTFQLFYDLNFPLRGRKLNKNLHKLNEFMTKGLLTSRLTKINLQKLAVQSPTVYNIDKYKSYRNLYNRILRTSKKMYYCESLNKAKKNPKRTWELINDALNRPSMLPKVDKLNINNNCITEPKQIANAFNKFFSEAGVNIANSVNPTNLTPENFLNETVAPELQLGLTSPAEVANIIKAFQTKNSSDIDGVSIKLLKSVAVEISFPLSHIFNLSLSTGVFPEALKRSRVVPVHKQGSKDNCDNYRPIALLSSISKILERFVATKLVNHLELNKLLNKNQFGFQRGKNTEQNLIKCLNIISNALNKGEFCIGIFIDLRKAFDVCSHKILLKKLKNLGVKDVALEWFRSYLANRKQQVDIQNNLSDQITFNISVLQGSILGPILFLCYINDLPNSSALETLLFADDTAGFKSGKNLPELMDQVNAELKKWASWFRANKMAVNVKKTKFIIFHSKGKKCDLEGRRLIFDDNEHDLPYDQSKVSEIERVWDGHEDTEMRAYKTLGVYFDESLSFNKHVEVMVSKLSRAIYMLNRVKNILPVDALKSVYFALFHSHLLYCPTVISCSSNTNLDKIVKIQKKAIRIISHANYNAHTAPLFTKHNIMPYMSIIKQSKITFMHSYHHKYLSSAFDGTWVTNADRGGHHELRNADDYYIPMAHTNFLSRFPMFSLPREWNMAGAAKYHHNQLTFKIELKKELLNEAGPPPPPPPPLNPPPPPNAPP
jgi:hypothetical protein